MQLTTETPQFREAGSPTRLSPSPSGPAVEYAEFCPRKKANGSAPKQILVIDDNAAIRDFIAKLISQAGFQADTAQDGEEGWVAFCCTDYDMVITDHQMPKLTGLNLIRRVRRVSVEAPCILISSSLPEPESTLKQLIDPGAVLAKPFKAGELIETVFSLLQRSTGQDT